MLYATWDLLRHARTASQSQPLTAIARHSATARLAAATHLRAWLNHRVLDLAGCRQPDLDACLVEHPTSRTNLHGFLAWAYRTHRSHQLTITSGPKPLPRTVAADAEQRWTIADALLHDDGYTRADRVAGLLMLLFGQRPHRISRLTVDEAARPGGCNLRRASRNDPVDLLSSNGGDVVEVSVAVKHRAAVCSAAARWTGP